MEKVSRRNARAKAALNTEALYQAVNARRGELGISQLAAARDMGINYEQFLLRIRQGTTPNVGTFLLVMSWLGETDIAPYTNLAPHATSNLRRNRLGVLVPKPTVDSALRRAARIQNELVEKIAQAIEEQMELDPEGIEYATTVRNFLIPEDEEDAT